MLELNDVVLETVSGGWGSSFSFKKVTINNTNYADVKLSHVNLGKGSTLLIGVEQIIA